jgi:tetratricopeptide (TPR) repeat protein
MAGSKKARAASSSSAAPTPPPARARGRRAHGRAEAREPSREEAPRDPRWTRHATLVAVAALTAVLAWRTESSRDFGYHLATGRWILEHGAWPRVDSFTYTLSGRPYLDMHGLFQIALALAYRGGMVGVGLLRVGFAVATVGITWLSARQRGVRSPALLGLGFGVAILTFEVRLMTRPELASALCLAAQLWLLRRHADSGDRRWLFATVPLQLVWVYSHALSTFGVAVLGLYAGASLVAGLRRRAVDPAPWLALAGATAVMFLNPYGARGVAFLWDLQTRIQAGNPFAESISELVSPFSAQAAQLPALRAFKVMLVGTGAVVLARARRLSLFDLLVVALFGALAATRVRVVGLFAVAALPVALEAASGLGRSLSPRVRARTARAGTPAAVVVLLALAFVGEQTIAGGYYLLNRYPLRFGYGESPAVFPVGTVQALEDLALGGRIFNAIEAGGYLTMHRDPREKTFVDGRLEVIGEEFYQEYLRAMSGEGWPDVEARYQPTLALVPGNRRELLRRLQRDPAWSLVEVDAVALLFARDTPDHRAAIAASGERLRRLDAPAAATEEAIAPPPRPTGLAALLGPRRVPFDTWGRGANFLQVGMLEAARRELRQALLATDQPEPALVKTYVVVTAQLGRLDEARSWCRRLVELSPQDDEARALLARLEQSGS